MNKHTSQSKYIISCGKQHIKCRFKNQKQWLECNKSIFFPPSIVVCLDIFGLLLLLLLLLFSSHLAQSFVLFLFIHYRRCRYCYCHWLSLFDHFENKYKYHEIAKQTNERFLHYEINANDKTNNQFHMPSVVFFISFSFTKSATRQRGFIVFVYVQVCWSKRFRCDGFFYSSTLVVVCVQQIVRIEEWKNEQPYTIFSPMWIRIVRIFDFIALYAYQQQSSMSISWIIFIKI